MDFSKIVAVIVQFLNDDDTLLGLVDNIVPGFNRGQADRYLNGSHQSCLGVRSLNKNSQGLPGCAYHGESVQDHLIEFFIITVSDNDSAAAAIASRIEDLIKGGITKTLAGVGYQLIPGAISFNPVNDENFPERIEVVGTCRIKYYG